MEMIRPNGKSLVCEAYTCGNNTRYINDARIDPLDESKMNQFCQNGSNCQVYSCLEKASKHSNNVVITLLLLFKLLVLLF